MTHNHLVPGSSPGGTTLKTPLLEGFFVSMTPKVRLSSKLSSKDYIKPTESEFQNNQLFKF